jgi:hypothetical protein
MEGQGWWTFTELATGIVMDMPREGGRIKESRCVLELWAMALCAVDPLGDTGHVGEVPLVGLWGEIVFRHSGGINESVERNWGRRQEER